MPERANLPSTLKQDFDRDGFVSIPGFFSAEELAKVEQRLKRYVAEVVPSLPQNDAYYEVKGQPGTLKQMHRMMQNDSWFEDLFVSVRFMEVAELLLNGAAAPRNVEYFAKPPLVGTPTPPHQDGYYFMIEPNEALTMWLALDEITERNGCIRYVRGSHRKGMRPHAKSNVLGFSQGVTDYGAEDEAAEVPMLSQPGDLHIHQSMTIHRADGNATEHPRRALALVCYSAHARVNEEASAAYQRDLTEELAQAGKI